MRHLFSTKLRIILVVAVLLSAALAVVAGVTNQTLPGMIVQGILAPFRGAMNGLTNLAEQYYSYMFRYESLVAEIVASLLGSDLCLDIHASNIYLTEIPQIRINELFADRLDEQRRDNGRVNAAGECKKHLLIAYLPAERLKLLCNESLGKLRRGDALHGFGALVICHMVILQYLSFYTGIIHSPPRIGKKKSNSGTNKNRAASLSHSA